MQHSQETQDWFTDSQTDLSTQTVFEVDDPEDDQDVPEQLTDFDTHRTTDDGPRPLRVVEPPDTHRTRGPLETLNSRLGHTANRT